MSARRPRNDDDAEEIKGSPAKARTSVTEVTEITEATSTSSGPGLASRIREKRAASPDAEPDAATNTSSTDELRTTLPPPLSEIAAGEGRRLPERYTDLGRLGRGGFGEVRKVRDRALGRILAMKLLRPAVEHRERNRRRFLAEIKLAAGLSHPGILAVYDFGELTDGRLWFTMPVVHGRTLREVIKEAFAAEEEARPQQRRRLLDHFTRAAEAVAYAHDQGVIHRDLKPANIMVGRFGQVLVMDWGIARRVGDPIDQEEEARLAHSVEPEEDEEQQRLTQYGAVLGTPAYMAPEQALGRVDEHGSATDVYALGATLYHLLAGEAPARRSREPLPSDLPAELRAIVDKAMREEASARHADAGELAAEMKAFLDGARRRERALRELRAIEPLRPRGRALRDRAEELRREARDLLSAVPPYAPVEKKEPGWTKEEEAAAIEREAALLDTRWTQGIHGALVIEPGLKEAHEALADHYKDALIEAERARRQDEVARLEVLLAAHDRGKHAGILSGRGALTLLTDPPHARTTLHRYVEKKRRLVLESVRELGRTPIRELSVAKGSYLVELSAPGHETVRYPVLIERGQHWDGVPPEGGEPYPIPLPRRGELDEDEVYVPSGWAWLGGDPEAPDSLPLSRLWLDGFVIGRHPVTNEEYLAFLNALVDEGREEEALAACPRATPREKDAPGAPLAYGRSSKGHFTLLDRRDAERAEPRTPAVLMDWGAAVAYLRWLGRETESPLRLPHELEREKATRGVDGRVFPWGDLGDPSFACMMASHSDSAGPVVIDRFPHDESPYGMRGGAGNTRDYCSNLWTMEGPAIAQGRPSLDPAPPEDLGFRSVRGGSWASVENYCRAAARFVLRPGFCRPVIGLRSCRSFGARAG